MKCRIGITTDPDRRHQEWKRKVTVTNFTVLRTCRSKAEAQRMEDVFAAQMGCIAHHGGGDPTNPNRFWHVYRVDYV